MPLPPHPANNGPCLFPDARLVFLHGKESGPAGSKSKALAQACHAEGAGFWAPDFQAWPGPSERLAAACSVQPRQYPGQNLILAGSSLGGYLALRLAQAWKPQAMLLMAPAVGMQRYPDPASPPAPDCPCFVCAGLQDDIVPPENIRRWASQCAFPPQLRFAPDGHRLGNSLPLILTLFGQCLLACRPTNPCA